jgi:O-antigen ligase/tetratricopeptide (TPR) repeat protein
MPVNSATPMLGSKLRTLGVVLICAKVALVPLVFDPAADFAFTVPKALLSHGLAILLAGVMVALFLLLGRSFLIWSPLHIPVLAFLASNIAASLFAPYVSLAVYGTHARMLGLATVADWTTLYFAIALLVRTERETLALGGCAFVAAVAALAYEFLQVAGRDPIRWAEPEGLLSTMGNRTTLAEYLTVVAMGGLAFVVIGRRANFARFAIAVISVGLLGGAALTGTRSVFLGIAAGAGILVFLIWVLHPARHAKAVSLVVGGAAAAGLVALLTLTPVGARLGATLQPTRADGSDDVLISLEPSAAERVALYRTAFEIVRERPMLGYGPDNFVVGVAEFRSPGDPPNLLRGLTTSSHSWVAYIATGSGVLGLAMFVGVFLIAARLVVQAGFRVTPIVAATSLLALLGAGVTTTTDIAVDWVFWATTGAIAATTAVAPQVTLNPRKAARRKRRSSADPSDRSRPLRAIGAFATVGGALILASSGIVALDASRSAKGGNDFRLGGRPAAAVEATLHAARADSGRPEYWKFLGLAYAAAGRWPEASGAFERASLLAPYDVRYLGDEARAKLVLGRNGDRVATSAAIALADKVVQVDGNSPYAHLTRAVVMQVTGNLAEADRSVDQSLALDAKAPDETVYVTAAQVKIDLGRPADAVSVAHQGIAVLGPSPRSVSLRYELARALVALGRSAEALSELDAALAIGPNAAAEQLRARLRASVSN